MKTNATFTTNTNNRTNSANTSNKNNDADNLFNDAENMFNDPLFKPFKGFFKGTSSSDGNHQGFEHKRTPEYDNKQKEKSPQYEP
eukprot:UN20507